MKMQSTISSSKLPSGRPPSKAQARQVTTLLPPTPSTERPPVHAWTSTAHCTMPQLPTSHRCSYPGTQSTLTHTLVKLKVGVLLALGIHYYGQPSTHYSTMRSLILQAPKSARLMLNSQARTSSSSSTILTIAGGSSSLAVAAHQIVCAAASQ